MSKPRILTMLEENDEQLSRLRAAVRDCEPHRPNPGDADYQSPEQVAAIKRRLYGG